MYIRVGGCAWEVEIGRRTDIVCAERGGRAVRLAKDEGIIRHRVNDIALGHSSQRL